MSLSEPTYLLTRPVTQFISDARPTRLSPTALYSINLLLDELLQTIVHVSLTSPQPSQASSSVQPDGPLAQGETFTTERFKQAVLRTVGSRLGSMAVLEGGVAVQEWLRSSPPSMRGHAALKSGVAATAKGAGGDGPEDLFESLRSWVMTLFRLGAACPPSGPASLTHHLQSLTPPAPAPSPQSPHLSFPLALYAERTLSAISDRIVSLVGRIAERSSLILEAGCEELEAALGEDELVWAWYKNMKVKATIDEEASREKMRRKEGSERGSPMVSQPQSPIQGISAPLPPKPATRSLSGRGNSAYGRASQENAGGRLSASPSVSTPSMADSMGLGISQEDDEFDQLINSSKTLKVSLTPDRLRAMELEKLQRARAQQPAGGTRSPALPSIPQNTPPSSSSSPSNFASSPQRRLKARAAALGPDQIEEDSDEDLHPAGFRAKKETLIDLLNSPPPGWNSSPEAPRMALNPSQDSVESGFSTASGGGGVSDDSEKIEKWARTRPESRKKGLKPKDERVDLAVERQVNSDLVDFFAAPPPSSIAAQPAITPSGSAGSIPTIRSTTSPKVDSSAPHDTKRKKGLRGFFSAKSNSIGRKPTLDDTASMNGSARSSSPAFNDEAKRSASLTLPRPGPNGGSSGSTATKASIVAHERSSSSPPLPPPPAVQPRMKKSYSGISVNSSSLATPRPQPSSPVTSPSGVPVLGRLVTQPSPSNKVAEFQEVDGYVDAEEGPLESPLDRTLTATSSPPTTMTHLVSPPPDFAAYTPLASANPQNPYSPVPAQLAPSPTSPVRPPITARTKSSSTIPRVPPPVAYPSVASIAASAVHGSTVDVASLAAYLHRPSVSTIAWPEPALTDSDEGRTDSHVGSPGPMGNRSPVVSSVASSQVGREEGQDRRAEQQEEEKATTPTGGAFVGAERVRTPVGVSLLGRDPNGHQEERTSPHSSSPSMGLGSPIASNDNGGRNQPARRPSLAASRAVSEPAYVNLEATLRELRHCMTSAGSVAQCLALVDALLGVEPMEPDGNGLEGANEEQSAFEELSQARIAEFLLGGSDPSSSSPSPPPSSLPNETSSPIAHTTKATDASTDPVARPVSQSSSFHSATEESSSDSPLADAPTSKVTANGVPASFGKSQATKEAGGTVSEKAFGVVHSAVSSFVEKVSS